MDTSAQSMPMRESLESPINMLWSVKSSLTFEGLVMRYFVFLALRDYWHKTIHSLFIRQVASSKSDATLFCCLMSAVVCSANEYLLPSHVTPISFTYSRYNSVPRIEP